MDLEDQRRKHYARAAKRYDGVRDEPIDTAPLPSHLRQDNHFPDVWHVDLIEWEQQGSAAESCADVLLDMRWPDLIRRKAMLARLTAFAVESRPEDASGPATAARVRLADQLAQLQLYAVLSPLEKLFTRPERPTKVAVLAAMQQLFFKRSFVTVRTGLRDSDPAVVEQASKAVEVALFPARLRSALADRARVAAAAGTGVGAACARARRPRWRRPSSSSACSSTAPLPIAPPRSTGSSAPAAPASSSSHAAPCTPPRPKCRPPS